MQNKNILIYFASDLLAKAIPFLLIPLLTRYLSPTEYGDISILNIAIEIITILILLGANTYFRVEFFKTSDKNALLYNLFSNVFINFVILTLVLIIVSFYFKNITFNIQNLIFISIISFFQSIFYIITSYYQCSEKSIIVGISNISFSIISNILFITLIIYGLREEARYYSYFIGISLISITLLFKLTIKNKHNIKKPFIDKSYYKFGFSILPHAISWWARSGMERIIISYFMSNFYVGIYSLSLQFVSLLVIISNAVNQAIAPSMMLALNNKRKKEINKLINKSLIINTLCCLSLSVFSIFFISFFISKEYMEVRYVLALMSLGYIFQSIISTYSNVIYFFNNNLFLSKVTFISSFINIALVYLSMNYISSLYSVVIISIITYLITSIIIIIKSKKLIIKGTEC
ncbi:lipopolysaccharide biosynthesis protein [Proteus sp. G2671]|uniref:Wzx n=1 Tax=Proteus penneri TaxID=102862 RepID=A0A385JP38_9GAMM|nr:oligosaccharide flippase family protein [Proteus sp. G2671]AXZ00057.1 wzx [Proteus penneri]NBM01619.1 oligosaccharide flippase family protein [Proteus sp. G2671]